MRQIRFFVPSNRRTESGKLKGLDGLNEIIAANRADRHVGAKQEKQNLQNVMTFAKAAMIQERFKPIEGMAHVHIEFVEPNRRRDPSNIYAASKYILDAITNPRGKKPGCGLIADDSAAHCELSMSVTYAKGKAGAWVMVEEVRE